MLLATDGLEPCRQISGGSDSEQTEIIVITGCIGVVDAVRARESGYGDDVLLKKKNEKLKQ